jgi:hypothetical protein
VKKRRGRRRSRRCWGHGDGFFMSLLLARRIETTAAGHEDRVLVHVDGVWWTAILLWGNYSVSCAFAGGCEAPWNAMPRLSS